jgi:hypothetical protein
MADAQIFGFLAFACRMSLLGKLVQPFSGDSSKSDSVASPLEKYCNFS